MDLRFGHATPPHSHTTHSTRRAGAQGRARARARGRSVGPHTHTHVRCRSVVGRSGNTQNSVRSRVFRNTEKTAAPALPQIRCIIPKQVDYKTPQVGGKPRRPAENSAGRRKIAQAGGKITHTGGKIPHTGGKIPHTGGKIPRTAPLPLPTVTNNTVRNGRDHSQRVNIDVQPPPSQVGGIGRPAQTPQPPPHHTPVDNCVGDVVAFF